MHRRTFSCWCWTRSSRRIFFSFNRGVWYLVSLRLLLSIYLHIFLSSRPYFNLKDNFIYFGSHTYNVCFIFIYHILLGIGSQLLNLSNRLTMMNIDCTRVWYIWIIVYKTPIIYILTLIRCINNNKWITQK